MKRYGFLWESIISLENLISAAKKAQKAKRFRDNVLYFNYYLEDELCKLREELKEKVYNPGSYKTFQIFEPKKRTISAAPYRDRVVHHALCNIIVPIFERTFISDSYANRVGFGSHRALKRFTSYLRNNKYVLQCDIKKYFPSIDHGILKTIIRRMIKCPNTLWLIDKIIDNSNPQEPVNEYFPGDDLFTPFERKRGLPIGNLTSQFFANVYLNNFDHFIKENLRAKRYIRYVDDFAIFSNSKNELADWKSILEEELVKYRLKIHPVKSRITEVKYGVNFLGFRVFPDKIRVRNENLRRARKRIKLLREKYSDGIITFDEVRQSIQSWMAHLKHGDTYNLRKNILKELVF